MLGFALVPVGTLCPVQAFDCCVEWAFWHAGHPMYATPFDPNRFQEPTMAVQQNKKSPSKRGMHRSHNALNVPGIAVEPTTGEIHLRHHISPNGFYRGRQVLKNKSEA
jgi:large subunit ribosomal protein L32